MSDVIKNLNVFASDKRFVDFAGLDYFWDKAKKYVDDADTVLSGRINKVAGDLADLQATVGELTGNAGAGQSIADRINAAITALKLEETYEKVGVAETKANAAKDAAIAAANKYTDDEIAELDGKASGYAAQALADAKSYADDLDNVMSGRVAVLEAIDHDKLAADASAAAVATILDGAPEKFDTLKEVAQWIADSESAASAADLVTRVGALESGKADTTYVDDLDTAMSGRVDVLEAAKDNYVAADTELASTLRGEIATAKSGAISDAKAYTDAEVKKVSDTVAELSGTVTSNLTEAKSYADGVAATAEANAKADTVEKLKSYTTTTDMEAAIAAAKTAAIADAKGKIDSLTTVVNAKADTTYVDSQDATVLAGAKAYASAYTDQLFSSVKFASEAEIDGIFKVVAE